MTNPLSKTKLFRSRLASLKWFAALAAAGAVTFLASIVTLPGGWGIAAPVQAFSKQTREAGASTFHEKGCEHCHGVDGVGSGRGPDLFGIGKRWNKVHIEQQIRDGGGGMPAFGDVLEADEIKNLVDYLSAKRKAPKSRPADPIPVKPTTDDSGL